VLYKITIIKENTVNQPFPPLVETILYKPDENTLQFKTRREATNNISGGGTPNQFNSRV